VHVDGHYFHIQWKGIVSTSKDKQVAMNFSKGKASCGTKGLLMRIWTSSGVSIENFSWFGKRESEVVLGPNVFFVVSRALYTDPDGLEMIDLVQLPEEGALRCDRHHKEDARAMDSFSAGSRL
jgi:hypothetical protein